MAPTLAASTREEREAYVRERFVCLGNCDLCGLCKIFHGTNPEQAMQPYIDGQEEFAAVMMRYRHR